jgi:hypothetical protein
MGISFSKISLRAPLVSLSFETICGLIRMQDEAKLSIPRQFAEKHPMGLMHSLAYHTMVVPERVRLSARFSSGPR